MSTPTYPSSSYEAQNDVIRIPEQFPITNKSLTEWSTFIANNALLHVILGLPKPKPIADAAQPTSEKSPEVSEDESEDEDRQLEASLEMLESVPSTIIDNASRYEASINEIHRQQMIDDAMPYVCILYFFLIVGQHC